MREEKFRFGEHHIHDSCKERVNFWNPLDHLVIGVSKIADSELVKNSLCYGIRGIRIFGILNDAEKAIQKFISLGGTRKKPEISYYPPANVDPASLPTGTIFRINVVSESFLLPTPLPQYLTKFTRSSVFSDSIVISDGHISSRLRQLGIVAEAPDPSKKMAVYTQEPDYMVTEGKGSFASMDSFDSLGKWFHMVALIPDLVNVKNIQYHMFIRGVSLDILQVGVEEKARERISTLSLNPSRI